MKKHLLTFLPAYVFALLALASLALAATPPAENPAVLSQTTRNGVTTLITSGRVQTEGALNADGTVTFTVFPTVVRLDSSGEPIAPPALDVAAGFTVKLPPALVAQILAEVKAAYLADQAAKAAAPAP